MRGYSLHGHVFLMYCEKFIVGALERGCFIISITDHQYVDTVSNMYRHTGNQGPVVQN